MVDVREYEQKQRAAGDPAYQLPQAEAELVKKYFELKVLWYEIKEIEDRIAKEFDRKERGKATTINVTKARILCMDEMDWIYEQALKGGWEDELEKCPF